MRLISDAAVMLLAAGISAQSPQADLDRRLAQDRLVVGAMLDDLATYRGEDSPIVGPFAPDPLTLDPTPLRYAIPSGALPKPYDPKAWLDLPASETPRLKEAAQDLGRRMRGPMLRFTAGSQLVPLYKGSDPSKLTPFEHRKAPLQASMPGYSKDGQTAILTLSIPWSIHRCYGTYVIALESGLWRVRVRDFACVL